MDSTKFLRRALAPKIKMDSGFRRNDGQRIDALRCRSIIRLVRAVPVNCVKSPARRRTPSPPNPPLEGEGLVARPLMSRRIADESSHCS
jgi:hypothetical protein